MDITAKQIISEIEKKYPPAQDLVIKNLSDINLEARYSKAYQHIIGITRADFFGGQVGIESYKRKMDEIIKSAYLDYYCTGWPFRGYELNEARVLLQELSDYYNANLNIEDMLRRLNIRSDDDESYFYIMVTVVIIPNFYIE